MEKGKRLLQRLADQSELVPLIPVPIVEIAGDHRVLIENHCGVTAYSRERILVKVGYGCVCICGFGLEIVRMSKEQLIIQGRIDGITLQRRD